MPQNKDVFQRGPNLPPKQSLDKRAVGMALAAHGLLLLALVLNLDWKTETQGPMQIELWANGNSPVSPPPQSTKPEVKPEPTPPKPEPEPEPEPVKPPPPPEPPPPPAPPAVAETPKNEIDPEIALENERKKKAEKERLEKELADKKAKEDDRKEKERIKREKDAAEKKERERIDQQRREVERVEKEKKEKEEKEKKAVADKKEKEKKEKEEKEKKLAEEKKAKEAKEAAAKKAAADQAFKDAMRGDVMGAAGIPGGTADRNQAGGGNYSGYGAKVRACIQPGVSFPAPPQSGSNPTAQYRVQLKSDGTVSGVSLLKTSGNPNFDRAVETGIRRCTPFPKPDTAKYPSYIDVDYRMY